MPSRQVSSGTDPFPERLRATMEDRRIGVVRLAAASGIHRGQIQQYRSGRVAPRDQFGHPTENAGKLAAALDVDVAWLVPRAKPWWRKDAA